MSLVRVAPLALLFVCQASFALQPDKTGCSDHPLFPTRMANYRIEACETKAFDTFELFASKGARTTVEGRCTKITYAVERREDDQSGITVIRNYENAVIKIGGTVADTDPQRWVNGSVVVDGRRVWFQAEKGNGKIWLTIVEEQAMGQQIVADAASFANDLTASGHVAVYGILFDTGKSVLKPESEAALLEVKRLLTADPGLKLWVVGHTDSTGSFDDNMRLAQARAEAVVTALTSSHGIAATRLKGYGVGPLAPVASNASDEGRARNRRVELVRQ